jgi:peroxiredoxin
MSVKAIVSTVIVVGMLASSVVGLWAVSQQTQPNQPADANAALAQTSASPNVQALDPFGQLHLLATSTLVPSKPFVSVQGEEVQLVNDKGLSHVLVFYQGHFCGVCGAQLEAFQAKLAEFDKQKVKLVAISADDADLAGQTVGERGLGFAVVPDPDHELIEAFGVANRVRDNIAYPTVYVVKPNGQVSLAFADPQGRRLQAEEVLVFLDKGSLPSPTEAVAKAPASAPHQG